MKGAFFTFITLLIIGGLCAGGYFAITSLTKPASYINTKTETVGDLHSVSTDPDTSIAGTTAAAVTGSTAATATGSAAAPTTPSTTTPSSDNSVLASAIATMISSKATVKLGDKNANVGTIQQFVNLYFKKTVTIDNVFSKTLQANIITFQKQNKITATGTVGPTTLKMMQLWLKNHSS